MEVERGTGLAVENVESVSLATLCLVEVSTLEQQ